MTTLTAPTTYTPGMYGPTPATVDANRCCKWTELTGNGWTWKDAPSGNIRAVAYRLVGDPFGYHAPQRWGYELQAITRFSHLAVPGTRGTADTLDDARTTAADLLADFMGPHDPATS